MSYHGSNNGRNHQQYESDNRMKRGRGWNDIYNHELSEVDDNNDDRKRRRPQIDNNNPTTVPFVGGGNGIKGHASSTDSSVKKSREELERERQIRMASIRAEIDDVDDTKFKTQSSATNNNLNKHYNTKQQHQEQKSSNSINSSDINQSKTLKKSNKVDTEITTEQDNNDTDDDESATAANMMKELFGMSDFGSTKNTKVITNHTSAAIGTISKHLKPRKYRQYMNRKNGFNRPLDNK